MTKLTAEQTRAFTGEFLVDEMDMIFNGMTETDIVKLFGTNDSLEIFEMIKSSAKEIKTQEDLVEGFSDKYVHIFDDSSEEFTIVFE